MALPSKPTLTAIAASVNALGQKRVNPSVYLRPIAQTISNKPAVMRISQFILCSLCGGRVVPAKNRNRRGRPLAGMLLNLALLAVVVAAVFFRAGLMHW